ncbi:MAG TPA: NLP/P60 hydrolase, partial [Sulfitobacter sp.]|nr:NLP/P60 hydrolase [Sulfitobacter sp.]
MTDRRLHPDPERITEKTAAQITLPVVDLNRSPDGPRDRQALYGEALTVLDRTDGTAYVQLTKDNYCGYISETAIGPAVRPTHVVTAPATHAYTRADLKSPDVSSLSFGSRV